MIYEIQIAGVIGPVVASCLPEFTAETVPAGTVLNGVVTGPDGLLEVLNLLAAEGYSPTDIWLSPVPATS
jgi:hypothetical protein